MVTADTITDDQIVQLVRHKLATIKGPERIWWLGAGDEAMADPSVGAPYKPYCRRRLAEEWNKIFGCAGQP